jgi:alkanesulfonate monooxygenase SsuD/methylene tetrahydromethanopterin reductase-like flavin-dependent oxidoreductase (luciferase family)
LLSLPSLSAAIGEKGLQMVQVGLLMTDIPNSVSPEQQFSDIRRVLDAAVEAGFTYISFGQHFLYGDLSYMQPVPLLARLAAHVGPDIKLVTSVIIAPVYHPVMLAEEIATLDVVTEGRLIFGVGIGYRPDELEYFGVPFTERGARTDESLIIMKKLWTEDEVTYEGRFWTLDHVRPHLKPVQKPHTPIWVGGHSLAGARRAGRFGDAFTVPPETTVEETRERFALVQAGFAARGMPFGPQPFRRNVFVADTHEAAVEGYARLAQKRLITYAERGLNLVDGTDLRDNFEAAVSSHAVLGTLDEVIEKVVDLVTTLPIDPLLMRPQWPTMSADEAIATMKQLGREILPVINAVPPAAPVPA